MKSPPIAAVAAAIRSRCGFFTNRTCRICRPITHINSRVTGVWASDVPTRARGRGPCAGRQAGRLARTRPRTAAGGAMANELRPQITVVTGDLITERDDRLSDCIGILNGLRADAGVFGCLGNHENSARCEGRGRRQHGPDLLHPLGCLSAQRLSGVGEDLEVGSRDAPPGPVGRRGFRREREVKASRR